MPKHRSIGYRIERARTLAVRREVATDWSINWYADHLETLSNLEKALGARDIASAGRYCGQLKALHEKAFAALPRVIEALTDEDIV
jgi:hypothetical protein